MNMLLEVDNTFQQLGNNLMVAHVFVYRIE